MLVTLTKGRTCNLLQQPILEYLATCRQVAGPTDPKIQDCREDTDPCNVRLRTNCLPCNINTN